tara:strand:- start:52 stop:627 length:576 start_codon:yes stop_codon:yes gene_type:complete
MLETFLIGGLSAVIPLLLFYTIGGKNTLYVFIGVCVLGLLVGIFEDMNFGSSDSKKQSTTNNLIRPSQIPPKSEWLTASVYGKEYKMTPKELFITGTQADTRTVTAGGKTYRLPKDSVTRCAFYKVLEDIHGYSVDPSYSIKAGNEVAVTFDGVEYSAIMPVHRGERCVVYGELENTSYGLYKYGRPDDGF